MAINGFIGGCLDDLLTAVQGELPTQIGLMETAESITMTDPQEYVVEQEPGDRTIRLPVCVLRVEGSVDPENEWGGNQQIIDYRIGLIAMVLHHHGSDSSNESTDLESHRYARCLQEALAKVATTVTGVYRLVNRDIQPIRWGENERYGAGVVRADVIFRTTLQRPT